MTDPIDAPLQREPGHYHVKVQGEWRVATMKRSWSIDTWHVAGYGAGGRSVYTAELDEIGPRILPPGEPAPKAEASDKLRSAIWAYYGYDVDQNDIDPDSDSGEAAAIERIIAVMAGAEEAALCAGEKADG